MVVRLPRVEQATSSLEKELQWLPRLGPRLPLAVPIPLATGVPAEGYPWRWAVHRWLEGETATPDRIADPCEAATGLARFVAALQRIDARDGPLPGEHNWFKGERLANRDDTTRRAIAALHGMVDVDMVTAARTPTQCSPEWPDATSLKFSPITRRRLANPPFSRPIQARPQVGTAARAPLPVRHPDRWTGRAIWRF